VNTTNFFLKEIIKMKPNLKLRALFADVLYDALFNTKDYDEELIEIYQNWFDDEPEPLVWKRICDDIEDHINTYILGGAKFEEEE
jgi:hypothetical protein